MRTWQEIQNITQSLRSLVQEERWTQADELILARDHLLRSVLQDQPVLTATLTEQLNFILTENIVLNEKLQKRQKRVGEQLQSLHQFKKYAHEYQQYGD